MIETLNDMRQYNQSNSLLLRNMPNYRSDLNEFEFTNYVCCQLNYLLPNLTCKLNYSHIEATHPLQQKEDGRTPVIIVGFKYRANGNDVYKYKRDLKGSRVIISEHLIPERRNLLLNLQKYIPLKNTWSYKGKIFAVINGEKRHIKNNEELMEIVKKLNLPELPKTFYKPRKGDYSQKQESPNHYSNNSFVDFSGTSQYPPNFKQNPWYQAQVPYYNPADFPAAQAMPSGGA